MGRLSGRIRKIEENLGYRNPKVHAIPWREHQESEQQAEERYLSKNPGNKIHPGDIRVFIRKLGRVEEAI